MVIKGNIYIFLKKFNIKPKRSVNNMTEHKIKVYSTDACPWCHKAKDWLKENNIEFEDINVGEDQEAAKEMAEKSGQRGVPVIMVDDEIIIGFNEEKLKELLGL
jgi:glutaredoxin-like YruB-family protein